MKRSSVLFTELDRRLSLSNNNQNKRKYKEENKKCRKNRQREKQRDFDKVNNKNDLLILHSFIYSVLFSNIHVLPRLYILFESFVLLSRHLRMSSTMYIILYRFHNFCFFFSETISTPLI